MRLLQLSDPHLLADPMALCRGRLPWLQLDEALRQARLSVGGTWGQADLLLISGDLCHDDSWLGYAVLRDLLSDLQREQGIRIALLPGNHDHPQLLRAVVGRHGSLAPTLVTGTAADLVLLDSHRPGSDAGWLGSAQLRWLQQVLAARRAAPLLVALHHPPVAIGDPGFDAIALNDGPALLELLQPEVDLRAVLFGHIHQHWQGVFPGRSEVLLLGCPSTLCSYGPVQPCPLNRAAEPGGRLLEIGPDGLLRQRLLRWPALVPPSLRPRSGSVGPAD
jgi:Icc protein